MAKIISNIEDPVYIQSLSNIKVATLKTRIAALIGKVESPVNESGTTYIFHAIKVVKTASYINISMCSNDEKDDVSTKDNYYPITNKYILLLILQDLKRAYLKYSGTEVPDESQE